MPHESIRGKADWLMNDSVQNGAYSCGPYGDSKYCWPKTHSSETTRVLTVHSFMSSFNIYIIHLVFHFNFIYMVLYGGRTFGELYKITFLSIFHHTSLFFFADLKFIFGKISVWVGISWQSNGFILWNWTHILLYIMRILILLCKRVSKLKGVLMVPLKW